MPSIKRIALGLATLNLPLTTLAEPSELETIRVEGTRMERSLLDTPAAVSVVDANTAQQGQQNIQLDESLARVPGLYMQNRYNFAQNQRLSIRGFGARAPGERAALMGSWLAFGCQALTRSPAFVARASSRVSHTARSIKRARR